MMFNPLGKSADCSYGSHPAMKYDEFPVNDKSAPVVMFWHGGSWKSGNKNHYQYVGRCLQKMGVHAIIVGYRLFPEQTFPGFIDDAKLAVEVVKKQYPNRPIYLMGHSAGGHIALITAMTSPAKTVSGCVAIAAPCYIGKHYQNIFGQAMENNLQDPRSYIKQIPPGMRFCLIHGRRDHIVKLKDSESLHKLLLANGTPCTLLINKLTGHFSILAALFFGRLPAIKRQLRELLMR
ncbi:MAG: alpha/beta hydrolase [Candidatus Saccharimonadales bacterium]